MTVTVEIKSGSASPHRVTLSDDGGSLEMQCSCQADSGEGWCSHITAVLCRDRAALAGVIDYTPQELAIQVAERHLDLVAVMTSHLDSIKSDPARAAEAQALQAAIAKRVARIPIVASIGAGVAAFGVSSFIWHVSWWQTGSGYVSAGPFRLPLILAAAGWAVLRFSRPTRSLSSRPGLRTLLQRLLGVTAVFLVLATYLAAYYDPKAVGYRYAMTADLRNLVTAEESFFGDSGRYAASLPDERYRTSSGVLEPNITLTPDGWTASVDHPGSQRTCVIFVGSTPKAPAVREGEPACTPLLFLFPVRRAVWDVGIFVAGLLVGLLGVLARRRSASPSSPGSI